VSPRSLPAEDVESDLRRLQSFSTSPYPPEPPRRSRLVNLSMAAARRLGREPYVTPHLHGGSSQEKVRWEYERAEEFWEVVGDAASPAILDGKDVLDVGCGWGGKAIRLAESTRLRAITGFDLPGIFDPSAPEEFARSRGTENVTFVVGRAEEIPFPDETFDVVIMEDVLEHVADPPVVLSECRRVLRPGGRVVARFPSIRMLNAHHLDRAIPLPGLHYILPMRTWARGLNWVLLQGDGSKVFEPFSRIVSTRYRRNVTQNLNGLDLESFRGVVRESGLHVDYLGLAAYPRAKFGDSERLYGIYRLVRRIPMLREPLSRSIVFVGVR
jgi:2-polyprenyl-3-methyl-5-hydroxy-6-metoxy-1,4-benzoquinol methylase